VLLFHGTGGDRALVDKICSEGLRPSDHHEWAHDTTGIASHVFACTTPVGTRGGDPIAYAQARAWNDRRAWLFVLDVPASLVRGAVPNGELEQYWNVRTFASIAFDENAGALRSLIDRKRERRCATRELLHYRVISTAPGLCSGEPDAHTLIQFEHAYLRVNTRSAKQRVATSYGLRIPDDFADDHKPWCPACVNQLFEIAIAAEPALQFFRGSWQRVDLETFGALVDATDRWLTAVGDPPFRSFAALQREHPPPRDAVPRTMWPDFVTADLATRMKVADTQVLLDRVPPEHIVGAIDIGDDDRLSSRVRPRDGEVLLDKLWYLARQLSDRRRGASAPIVLVD